MSPTRRTVLRRGGALLTVAVAGCNEREPGESPGATGATPSTDSATPTATPERAAGGVDASLHRYAYILGGEEVRPQTPWTPKARSTPIADLRDPARDAVVTAIESGRYETNDPPKDVLAGVEGVDLVAHDGEYYAISHTFTEYVLDLGAEADRSEIPDARIASYDDVRDEPSVRTAVSTLTASGTHNPRQEYRTLVLTPALSSFVDEYDYVEDHRGIARLRYHVVRQFPPYVLTAEPATDEQRYGQEVVDGERLTEHGRQLVRETVSSKRPTSVNLDREEQSRRGVLFRDSVPLALERWMDRSSLVRLDGTVYHVTVYHAHWDRQPFDLAVDVATDGPGREEPIEVTVAATNTSSFPASLEVPGLPPFGILWAVPEDDGEPVQLWHPEYESSDHVAIEDGVAVPDSYWQEIALSPDETVERTYRLGREAGVVSPGTYTVWASLGARWQTEPGQKKYDWNRAGYPYEVTLTVPDV